jgi:hypothetical protein
MPFCFVGYCGNGMIVSTFGRFFRHSEKEIINIIKFINLVK